MSSQTHDPDLSMGLNALHIGIAGLMIGILWWFFGTVLDLVDLAIMVVFTLMIVVVFGASGELLQNIANRISLRKLAERLRSKREPTGLA